MQIGEKQVKIAAQLYTARDALRRLHGDEYPKIIKTFKEAIQNKMKEKGVSELRATLQLCNDLVDNPNLCLHLMAAVVELIEPTKEATDANP